MVGDRLPISSFSPSSSSPYEMEYESYSPNIADGCTLGEASSPMDDAFEVSFTASVAVHVGSTDGDRDASSSIEYEYENSHALGSGVGFEESVGAGAGTAAEVGRGTGPSV